MTSNQSWYRGYSKSNPAVSSRWSNGNEQQLNGSILQRVALVVGTFLLALPWIYHSSLNFHVGTLREKIDEIEYQQKRFTDSLDTNINAFKKFKSAAAKLDEENASILNAILAQQHHRDPSDETLKDDDDFYQLLADSNNEDALRYRISEIENEIRRAAKLRLRQRFGSNVDSIRVVLKLKHDVLDGSIVQQLSKNIKGDSITFEMGPIDVYPHAIDVFLRLIETEQYYDNTTLVLKATNTSTSVHSIPRVYETGIFLKDDDTAAESLSSPLQNAVAFKEYSTKTPMKKYSVCFTTGHDGKIGPHFYISMNDDRYNDSYNGDDSTPTDTCFAQVKDGRTVLEYIVRDNKKTKGNKKRNSKLYMLGIESIRIDPKSAATATKRNDGNSVNL